MTDQNQSNPTTPTPKDSVSLSFPPQSDLPPMPSNLPNVTEEKPTDISSVIKPPKKKFGTGKIVATILGILLLVGGIGTGTYLVGQKQLLNQKASEGACSSAVEGACECSENNNYSSSTEDVAGIPTCIQTPDLKCPEICANSYRCSGNSCIRDLKNGGNFPSSSCGPGCGTTDDPNCSEKCTNTDSPHCQKDSSTRENNGYLCTCTDVAPAFTCGGVSYSDVWNCNAKSDSCSNSSSSDSNDSDGTIGSSDSNAGSSDTSVASPSPTATVSPTINPTGTPNSCGGTCGSDTNCQSDKTCYQSICRNPSCVTSVNCVCAPTSQTQTSPLPIPVTGFNWPTLATFGVGILVILGSILLVF